VAASRNIISGYKYQSINVEYSSQFYRNSNAESGRSEDGRKEAASQEKKWKMDN
jgi:hypothetical protein